MLMLTCFPSILILLLLPLSPSCHGLLTQLPGLQPRVKKTSQPITWTSASIPEDDSGSERDGGGIKSIFGILSLDAAKRRNVNIDYDRRARSLMRRDRLAQWRAAVTHVEDEVRDKQDSYFLLAAFLPAILAFGLWGDISVVLSMFLDAVGAVNRNTAEGISFVDSLLRPTIIGVVVPVISIALATLVSTTVNVLRQRQVDLRSYINEEAGELRFLRRAVFGMYGTRQHAGRRARALNLLLGYVEQLMRECEDGAVGRLEEMQLSGGIADNELDRFAGEFSWC